MTATILDGRKLSRALRTELRARAGELVHSLGRAPCLAVVLVGEDPPSQIYVSNKIKACREVGIDSRAHYLPATVSTSVVLELIEQMNSDPAIDGILVQLPLPAQIDGRQVLEAITVDKDVDGFHLYNVGGLVVGDTVFSPATPYGVIKLLESEKIAIDGMNVTVVGASNIVGKPIALMLMSRGATVTICHAKTRELSQHTILADILVVAAGCPGLIVPQMVKAGAVVIDVGINRLSDGRIAGDVDFSGVAKKAGYITPVPGGVGPMTITMLLENTIVSAERKLDGNNRGYESGLVPRSAELEGTVSGI